MEKTKLTGMTQEEVDSFLKEKKITVAVMWEEGYDKDGEYVDQIFDDEGNFKSHGEDAVNIERMWGFSSPNGFHTFEFSGLEEKEAQYLTVVFHKLYEDYDTSWNDAETLAYSYVKTCTVPYVPQPPMTEEEQEEVRNKLIECIDSGNVVIPKEVDENLFTKSGIVEDWKPDYENPMWKNIVEELGRFYWTDEHGLERYGPYDTIQEAKDSIENYCIGREEAWHSERMAKADQDAGCYDDPPYGGFYENDFNKGDNDE